MRALDYSEEMQDLSHEPVPVDVVHRIHHKFWTYLLFWSIVAGSMIAVPGYGLVFGYSWLDWTMFAVLYVITGLGITVGYHRLLTHRSFECPDWVKACLLIAGGWALQNSGAKWTADHLRHHAHCDDPADPYNAKRGFWYSHCGWLLNPVPCNDERFGSRVMQDRVAMWQHRHYAAIVLVGLALPFVVGFLYDGWKGGIGGFMLAGVGRTFAVLNSTFCINSVCHLWGEQPYSKANSSRNSWFVSLLTFGEGYHNYHHAYPSDYRNGPIWYNFDPSKWLIYALWKMGLASSLRTASSGV